MAHIIRQYKETDLSGVLSSWENANRMAHPFLPNAFVDKVRHDIPSLYLPNADTWVAEVDGKVLGFIALIGNEVGAIFVEPDLHGMGLGKALMDKAHSLHSTLEVEVFEKNTIGRKFYNNYGFKELLRKSHDETENMILRLIHS